MRWEVAVWKSEIAPNRNSFTSTHTQRSAWCGWKAATKDLSLCRHRFDHLSPRSICQYSFRFSYLHACCLYDFCWFDEPRFPLIAFGGGVSGACIVICIPCNVMQCCSSVPWTTCAMKHDLRTRSDVVVWVGNSMLRLGLMNRGCNPIRIFGDATKFLKSKGQQPGDGWNLVFERSQNTPTSTILCVSDNLYSIC